jgi:hypothetical protein
MHAVNISLHLLGPEDGEFITFLHGFPTCSHDYHQVRPPSISVPSMPFDTDVVPCALGWGCLVLITTLRACTAAGGPVVALPTAAVGLPGLR